MPYQLKKQTIQLVINRAWTADLVLQVIAFITSFCWIDQKKLKEEMEQKPKYKLIYFEGFRSRAEMIVLMFRLAEADFEYERIDLGNWPEEKGSKSMQYY